MDRALQREIGLNDQNEAKYVKIFRQRELNQTKRIAFWTKHSYPNNYEIKTVMQIITCYYIT